MFANDEEFPDDGFDLLIMNAPAQMADGTNTLRAEVDAAETKSEISQPELWEGEEWMDSIEVNDDDGTIKMPNTVSVTVLGKRTRSESSKTLTDDSLELQPWKIQRRGSISSHRLGSSRSSSTLIGSEASNADLDFAPFYLDNNEDSVNLSPSVPLQRIFNAYLPYAVQFEIARRVSLGKMSYGDECLETKKIVDFAKRFKTNADAMKNIGVLLPGFRVAAAAPQAPERLGFINAVLEKESAAKSPWEELDTEDKVLKEDSFGGLGFGKGPDGWYGGRVHFRGTLRIIDGRHAIVLEMPELGPSYQFARRFGSRSFFRLSIPASSWRGKQKLDTGFQFVGRPIRLCGRILRPFYAKDSTVFYVCTNEQCEQIARPLVYGTMSVEDFIQWHNPYRFNDNQTVAKYVSRFSLGLSSSGPGLQLQREDIEILDDVLSPVEKSDMTDGAGWINQAALIQIWRRCEGWPTIPTAIQCRIFGAKGMLSKHPSNTDTRPRVWLRKSQIKIKYDLAGDIDPAKLVVDVLRHSATHVAVRLSNEAIINLAENGVPTHALNRLMEETGERLIAGYLQWDTPHAMIDLFKLVSKEGGVVSARRAREDVGRARLFGYTNRYRELEDDDDDEGDDDEGISDERAQSVAWWPDPISGCPSTLPETLLHLLVAGFTPKSCPVLADKLEVFVASELKQRKESLKVEVEMAATAFLIPDPLGFLEPGEIFFQTSGRKFVMHDQSEATILLGDVLVGRSPTKLPGDVQKWRAVDYAQLHFLQDVIVCSTKGERRAADYLAGGDYDGDKAFVIWNPILVEPFRTAPPEQSLCPDIGRYFEAKTERMTDFIARTSHRSMTMLARRQEFSVYSLSCLNNTGLVGIYSLMHDCAVYKVGYREPETVRLAHMFCAVLDSSKTGLVVLKQTLEEDRRKFNQSIVWRELVNKAKKKKNSFIDDGRNGNPNRAKRRRELGVFVMDELQVYATRNYDKLRGKVESALKPCHEMRHGPDPDLTKPYLDALRRCERFPGSTNAIYLERIKEHVQSIWAAGRELTSKSFTLLPIEERQNKLRKLSEDFYFSPNTEEMDMDEGTVTKYKASCMYWYDAEMKRQKGWTRIPWNVAFRTLCDIKCKRRRDQAWVPVTLEFFNAMMVR